VNSITKGANASVPVASAVPWFVVFNPNMFRHGVDLPARGLRFATSSLAA